MIDEDADIQTFTLGGREWKVPPLAIRQLRKVRAPMIEMNQRFVQAAADGRETTDAYVELPEADFERLILSPVYHGLTRGNPELSLDQFLDLPVIDGELIQAWFAIRKASGIFVTSEGEQTSGEAMAA